MVASWPEYRFLRRQVRWSGMPISWRIFQFVVIYTVKSFIVVSKAEVDVFLELSCFYNNPTDVGNLISGSAAFSKTSWTCGSSRFMYCWSLASRILSITLLACEMSAFVLYVLYALKQLFFEIEMKRDFTTQWALNWMADGRSKCRLRTSLELLWVAALRAVLLLNGSAHTPGDQ